MEWDDRLIIQFGDGFATLLDGIINYDVRGDINCSVMGPRGCMYWTEAEQIFCIDLKNGGCAQEVTANFSGHPSGRKSVQCSPDGSIWVEGCRTRKLLNGTFGPVPECTFSGVPPVPLSADIYGNLWSLVDFECGRKVVVLPANQPHSWQDVWLPIGDWKHVIADSVGFVWLLGPSGLLKFCPRRTDWGWRPVNEDLPDSMVTAVGLSPNDLTMVCFSSGELLELDNDEDGNPVVDSIATIPGEGFCIHTDRNGAVWVATRDTLYRRDSESDAWQRNWEKKWGRLPGGGNHDIFSIECQKKLYVAGGWAGEWGLPPTARVCDELLAYDSDSEYWEIVGRMFVPRRYNGIAEMDGCVWVIGGETRIMERDGREGQVLYLVDIYDPMSGTWSAGPSLNVARTDPFVMSCNGRIYAIGGAAHNSEPVLDSVESIGPGEVVWRFETPLPEPTRQGHGCVLNDVLYCVSTDGVYAYDTQQRCWEENFPQPGDIGQGPLAAAFCGEVWVIGGYESQLIRCYNPLTRSWRSGPDLPTQQSWGAAVVMDGRLFVIGGAHYSNRHKCVIFDDRTYVFRDT